MSIIQPSSLVLALCCVSSSRFVLVLVAAKKKGRKAPKPSKVRRTCIEIFETAFPPQQWVTEHDLKAFSKLVATEQPNYFSCPEGGDRTLVNYSSED